MRILLYNWVPIGDSQRRGGGVGVYLENLANGLVDDGHEVFFLSSGLYYSCFSKKTFFKRKTTSKGIKSYIIYNSPIVAPSYESFFSDEYLCEDKQFDETVRTILEELKTIDVVHIHNLEGIPHNFFRIVRDNSPKSKILFTFHNYAPICSQVNLWYKNSVNCVTFDDGKKCTQCIPYSNKKSSLKLSIRNLPYSFLKIAKTVRRMFMRNKVSFQKNNKKVDIQINASKNFVDKRLNAVKTLNQYCDLMIAVSQRTRDIFVSHGVNPEKICVNYIGTSFAKKFKSGDVDLVKNYKEYLSIGYLGYARADKGFNFLVEELRGLSFDIAQKIRFIFAGIISHEERVVLNQLKGHLADVEIYNHYDHKILGKILNKIDLGLVTPIWEDNLPQVAIEFIAHGRPIVCSNMGGTKELVKNRDFIFDINEDKKLHNLLSKIVKRDLNLYEFWAGVELKEIREHLSDLYILYKKE